MFVSGAPRGVVAESRVSVDGTMQTVDGLWLLRAPGY
jgi:hypothetical protein